MSLLILLRVYTAAWSPAAGDWGGWWPINDARTTGPVWSVSRSRDKLDIFFTAPDGHIQTAAWPVNGRWGGPWVVSERWEFRPGNAAEFVSQAVPAVIEVVTAHFLLSVLNG